MKGLCSANLYYLWAGDEVKCFYICENMRCEDCWEWRNTEDLPYSKLKPLKKLFVRDPVERMAIEIHE